MNEVQVQANDLETAEFNVQIRTAKQFPRVVEKCLADIKKMACTSRNVAQSCIYFRPVGKKEGRQQFAEGGSIRLAEIVQSQWGNVRIGSRNLGEKDGKVVVQGVCHDLEKNVYVTSEVSKSIRRADGSRYSESQIQVVEMAAQSIARRNVVFSAISKAFIDDILDAIRATIVGDDLKAAWAGAQKAFKEIGATTKDLLMILGCESETEIGKEEIVKLHGIYNAINDDICPFEDVFGHGPKIESRNRPAEKQEETTGPIPGGPTEKQRFNTYSVSVTRIKGRKFVDDLIGVYETTTKTKQADFPENTWAAINADLSRILAKETK